METVTRKSLLYKSGLGFTCVNHVQGCSHGCRYPCYAFMMGRSYGRVASYEDWCRPRLVANAAELLERELSRKRKAPDDIHLCLSTDPFMVGFPEVTEMSLALVAIANAHGVPCSMLTKGLLPARLADRERFPEDNIHGISLVSLDEDFRGRWEPGAAPYAERIAAQRFLHGVGRKTLVHIEPYPTPNLSAQELEPLLEAVAYTDSIFFGGWNYNAAPREFPGYREFYRDRARKLRRFCEERGIECGTGA